MKKTATKKLVVIEDGNCDRFSITLTRLVELDGFRYLKLRDLGKIIRDYEKAGHVHTYPTIQVFSKEYTNSTFEFEVDCRFRRLCIGCKTFSGTNYTTLLRHAKRAFPKSKSKSKKSK